MSGYSHLLLAADFSPECEVVAERAARIAKLSGALLSIIHVVEFSPLDCGGEHILPVEIDFEWELMDRAGVAIRQLGERFGLAEKDLYVETGSTRAEILRVTNEQELEEHVDEGLQAIDDLFEYREVVKKSTDLLRTSLNAPDGVAETPKSGHLAPLRSPLWASCALSDTPRDALATAGEFFTTSEMPENRGRGIRSAFPTMPDVG